MTPTETLAHHVLKTSYEDLPADAVLAAKIFFLDTLGVGIAGARTEYTELVRSVASAWGQCDDATVLGSSLRLPAPSAAFVNAYQIHCQEFDCVHEAAVVHPMATLFSGLMAEMERRGGVRGRDAITALAVGVDVSAGLGVAAPSALKFFRPATAGIFGTTAAIASLRQFTPGQLLNAWGYALAQAGGTMQAHVEGKPALPIQIGHAARNAIVACDLAEAGLPGPEDSLTGPFGYLTLFEDEVDWEKGFGALGDVWRIAQVSHKHYPTGRAAQGGIVALQPLRERGVTAETLDRLVLTAPPLIHRLVGRRPVRPLTVNYARLCFAYLGATVLETGSVGLGEFTEAALGDEGRLSLSDRIFVEEAGTGTPFDFVPQTLTAYLKGGTVLTETVTAMPGGPGAPLSRDAHLEKFSACVRHGVPGVRDEDITHVIDRVDDLELEDNVGAFAALLR